MVYLAQVQICKADLVEEMNLDNLGLVNLGLVNLGLVE